MRTLTISRRSLYLRFFLWVWGSNPEDLNICKLFWGTLLFPLAFTGLKKTYRFIPRSVILIVILYMASAALFTALGWYIYAITLFICGAVIAIGSYLIMWTSQDADVRRKAKKRVLSDVTGRGEIVENWIFDHSIGLLFNLADNVIDSRVGQRVGGFFAVIGEYIRATKHHICPSIRVVD